MSETNASSTEVFTSELLTDLTTYRDKLITTDQTPYRNGYIDALNMAIFFVEADIHRAQLAQMGHLNAVNAGLFRSVQAVTQ